MFDFFGVDFDRDFFDFWGEFLFVFDLFGRVGSGGGSERVGALSIFCESSSSSSSPESNSPTAASERARRSARKKAVASFQDRARPTGRDDHRHPLPAASI